MAVAWLIGIKRTMGPSRQSVKFQVAVLDISASRSSASVVDLFQRKTYSIASACRQLLRLRALDEISKIPGFGTAAPTGADFPAKSGFRIGLIASFPMDRRSRGYAS
jgi:hypothetical protein